MIDFEAYQHGEDDYRFIRTTLGLLGFIIFFLGAFCAFIVAPELKESYEIAFGLGGVALGIMIICFFCVLKESKKIYEQLTPPQETVELQDLRPLPELPVEPQPEPQQQPFWDDKNRDDPEYVRQILGLEPGDPTETNNVENDSDSELQALQELGRTGMIPECRESMAKTSENPQVKDSTCSGGESTYEMLDYTKPGPSNVRDRSSEVIESGTDIPSLKCLATLSLSDTTEKPAENVSVALSKLSLDDSEKQADEVAEEDSPSTHSEGKSDEQQAETSKDAKDGKPTESE